MKKRLILLFLAFAVAVPLCAATPQSLGEIARKLREQRKEAGVKPVKVFTNDNLPARPPSEGPTASSGMAAAPAETATEAKPAAPAEATGQQSEAKPETAEDKMKTKEYWQSAFGAARAALAQAQEQQQASEDELNLLQIQQAQTMDMVTKGQLGQQVSAKQVEVTSKREETQKAREALDKLQKEFDESGAPKDWSKT
jgi:hypothetical protein